MLFAGSSETAKRYPHQRFHHVRGGCGGSGVLSQWPIEHFEAIPAVCDAIAGSWFPPSFAVIRLPDPECTLTLANVHLRPPLEDSGKGTPASARTAGVVRLHELHCLFSELAGKLKCLPNGRPMLIAGMHMHASARTQAHTCAYEHKCMLTAGDFNEQDGADALAHLQTLGMHMPWQSS